MVQSHAIYGSPRTDDVRYNPATGAFEGLVSFHTEAGRRRVAAQFPAGLDTSYDEAIAGLKADAIQSLDRPDALTSQLAARRDPARGNGRESEKPFTARLIDLFWNRAA